MSSLLGLLLLAWTTPSTREDGATLEPWEIAHYELQRNGEPYSVTTENTIDALRNGRYRVRACDHHDQCSVWSNEIRVSTKKKGRR